MTEHDAAERLATILLPYCRREIIEDLGTPDWLGAALHSFWWD
jgi:hypothetical protein